MTSIVSALMHMSTHTKEDAYTDAHINTLFGVVAVPLASSNMS